ncbi:MAG: Gfo/Idh/MocA family oxidoreductase [Candidatus Hinthialibacter antarcticus]|nr:Gfo/Idh/MocA family oxidoreductase [Candidatus Hinthialibacter antarcticus]
MQTRRRFLSTGVSMTAVSTFSVRSSSAAKDYKAAVIGRTGGGDYGHGYDRIFNGLDNISVVAVADHDENGRMKAAERSGAKRQYAEYREMLEKEKPDLVSIAPRQPDCHKDMAITAIESGAHVFMEKPITETLEDSDAIIRAAEKHGAKIFIAHNRRYTKLFRQIQQLIKDGSIGTVLEMRVYGKQDARAGGEDLIVLGVHDFDLMRLYFGDPLWCNATVQQDGRDITINDARLGREPYLVAGDTMCATFAFPNNIFCHWTSVKTDDHWNTNFSKREKWRFDVNGTKAIIAYQSGLEAAIWNSPFPAHTDGSVQWKDLPEPENWSLPEHEQHPIKNLIHAVENDVQPICSMYDGRWAIEMVSSVYESHFKQGRVAYPLKKRGHPLRQS